MIGPIPTPSYGNSRYVLTFIDDFSRNCWVFFLKPKSEVYEIFKAFKVFVENFSRNKVKILSIDKGKEYVNNMLQHVCE